MQGATRAGMVLPSLPAPHVAHLSYLAGYAILGAVFFPAWTIVGRKSLQPG